MRNTRINDFLESSEWPTCNENYYTQENSFLSVMTSSTILLLSKKLIVLTQPLVFDDFWSEMAKKCENMKIGGKLNFILGCLAIIFLFDIV